MSYLLSSYTNGTYQVFLYSNGTKMRYSKDNVYEPSFPESIDLKITSVCNGGCAYCYENCTPDGNHGDLKSALWLNSLVPGTEVAIGGNDLRHPDLLWLLQFLKKRGVVANMTVNQKHFTAFYPLLLKLSKDGLIHGLGVSLCEPTDSFFTLVSMFPNITVHLINGVVTAEQIDQLSAFSHSCDLRLLILGYKELGRGKEYISENEETLIFNKKILSDRLVELAEVCCCISFDNLALEQLDVQSVFFAECPEVWERVYMGEEAQYTFYIDAVENTFSCSSLTSEDVRYKIEPNMSVTDMFAIVRNN